MSPEPPVTSSDPDWSECNPPLPPLGTLVRTACGGTVYYSAATSCVFFEGQNYYFCLPICRSDFEANPAHSCMAEHIQATRRRS